MRAGLTRRRLLGGIAGGCALLLGTVAVTADPPRVVSVESKFGDVRDRRAEIDTEIVIENPNSWPIPGSHTIKYEVTLNGVAVAHGRERGVRIGTGQTVIKTTGQFDNTAIPDWWTTHVNSAETTTMRTQSRVYPAGLGISLPMPPEETEITTDFLGTLGESEVSTVLLGDREILVVGRQRAEWGTSRSDRSPLQFTTEVENVHERPVGIDGTDYEILMNDVVVGAGETSDTIQLAPGESGTVTVEAAIDTPKMQEWWVSHLRNDQSTDLTITVYAVSIDDSGGRTRLPFSILHQRSTFETDMLGTGETVVTPIEADPGEEFAEPTVLETTSDWGDVRETETDIETVVRLRSDNDEALSELLTLDLEQVTTIAGITVARGTDHVDRLPQGEGSVELLSTKPHAVVPEWWAAHLRNGERSVSRTVVTGDADVSVTTLPLDLEGRENTVETDLLGDLNDDSTPDITTSSGATLLVVHGTTGEWVDPTSEVGPIRVEADIENTSSEALVIREIDIAVDINGVLLADNRLPEEHRFAAGERKKVTFVLELDNSKMEAWWPTHIRNGEVSELTRNVTATVEGATTRKRTTLNFLSDVVEVDTDLLGE